MKAMKQMKQNPSKKWTENLPPGMKKRGKRKPDTLENEPMVLIPAEPGESVAHYSLTLPSVNKDRMLDEMDALRNITQHLNQIVYNMEHVYTKDGEMHKGEGEEEERSLVQYEEMTSFLISCSQLNNQLENALYEEKEILESLLKWFEKEVQQMEELGEEEIIPDWQVPVADKSITDNISKLMIRIQRLEELKGRVQELPKFVRVATPKYEKKKTVPVSVHKDAKGIAEDLAVKHATEDVMNMVHVFREDAGAPQTMESMNNRMLEIMKVFERQTNKLHRVANEQDVLESKLQKVQHEFQKLAEEKRIMEDELLKMKNLDVAQGKGIADAKKKFMAHLDKAKTEEKLVSPGSSERGSKRGSISQKQKESENVRMKEDLAKAQAHVHTLEKEKKMLEERLQKALLEAEKVKGQFAEMPPDIPDWQFPYSEIAEEEKELPRKGKRRSKSRGEDLKHSISGIDRTIPKLQQVDTAKAGERIRRKSQDISAAPHVKEIKHKKKGTSQLEAREGTHDQEKVTFSDSTSRLSVKKADGKPELVSKPKETAELKKRKGTGRERSLSIVSELTPLPPIQEMKTLPDSIRDKEKLQPLTLDLAESAKIISEMQEEVHLLPDSQRKEGEIMLGVQEEKETLPISLPCISEGEVDGSVTFSSVESTESITREPETSPLFVSGRIPTPELIGTTEGRKAAIIPSVIITPSAKDMSLALEKPFAMQRSLLSIGKDSLGPQVAEIKESLHQKMLQLADSLIQLEGMPEAESLAKLLLEPGNAVEELSDIQKLQLVNQLLPTHEGAEDQIAGVTEEGQANKRVLLAKIASTLQVLQQVSEAGLSGAGLTEEEANEIAEERKLLLENLNSSLRDLQAAQAQESIDAEIRESLHQKMLQLADSLIQLEGMPEAESLAKLLLEPGKAVEELSDIQKLQLVNQLLPTHEGAEDQIAGVTEEEQAKKRVLLAKIASTLQVLQQVSEAGLSGAGLTEEEANEIAEERKLLLENLNSSLRDLQAAQAQEGIDAEIRGRLQQKMLQLAGGLTELEGMPEADTLAKRSLEPGKGMVAEIKESLHQKMLQLADSLIQLEGMPEAESLAKLLLEPGKAVEELSDIQKLQLVNQLLPTDEGVEDQIAVITEEEQAKKRGLLAKIASTLQVLQQVSEAGLSGAGLSEEEANEIAEGKKFLLENLESSLRDLQAAQAQEDIEREIHELSKETSLLLDSLESNLNDLREAQKMASIEPSEMNESKVKELLNRREELTEMLEGNLKDRLKAKAQVVVLAEKDVHAKEINELSEERKGLLESLEVNMNILQETEALAATQPDTMTEEKIKALKEQRKLLIESLEANQQNLQRARFYTEGIAEESKLPETALHELNEKKKYLQERLESNLNDLQQAQEQASIQPDSIRDHILLRLNEERKHLAADLEATMHDVEKLQHRVLERPSTAKLNAKEFHELSKRKQFLLESLELNQKKLQEAQDLEDAEPGSNVQKIQELLEQRRYLNKELEATVNNLQEILNCALEKPDAMKAGEKEVSELDERKQNLLERLQSNLKELKEAQAVVPCSAQRIQELKDQRRQLAKDLEATVHGMQEVKQLASKKAQSVKPSEKQLQDLSERKKLLLEIMESNLKELQEAQALAATEPGSVDEKKIQELNKQRKLLAESLQFIVQERQDMNAYLSQQDEIKAPAVSEKDFKQLSHRKKLFLENLESNIKALEEAQKLAASHPSSINEQKVDVLTEQRRLLTAGLEAVTQDLQDIQIPLLAQSTIDPRERKLAELAEKQKLLLENIEANMKDLQEAEAHAAIEPGGMGEQMAKVLAEQRRLLTEGLTAIAQELERVQNFDSEEGEILKPIETKLDDLSARRKLVFNQMESNLKDLKRFQALAIIDPTGVTEQKIKAMIEKKKILAASLEAILQDMQEAQDLDLSQGITARSDEKKRNDALEIMQLETKLEELHEAGALTHLQLDSMKRKLRKLKEQRMLMDRLLTVPVPEAQEFGRKRFKKFELDDDHIRELLEKKRGLFAYLQSSLKNLQQSGIIQLSGSTIKSPAASQERAVIEDYQVAKQVELPRYDEQIVKQKILAAKLEANLKDLQAAYKAQQLAEQRRSLIENLQFAKVVKRSDVSQETPSAPLKPPVKGLQLHIRKVPEMKTTTEDELNKKSKEPEMDISAIQYLILKKELEQALKRQQMQQASVRRTSSPIVPSVPSELLVNNYKVDDILQNILDSNKNQFPANKANLPQALLHARYQLQQANIREIAKEQPEEKEISMSFVRSSPSNAPPTTKFHEYSPLLSRPVWEANQLLPRQNAPKLNIFKKKVILPEVKGLPGSPPSQASSLTPISSHEKDPMFISGKAYGSQESKHGLLSAAMKQRLRSD